MLSVERVRDAIHRVRKVEWEKNYGVSQVHFEDILLCAMATELWLDEQEEQGGKNADSKPTGEGASDPDKG